MVIVKICLKKQYLAEFLTGKYFSKEKDCVQIPDHLDLYHKVWDLLSKRPTNSAPELTGNVSLGLPDRRIGKDPATYNYLSYRALKIIEKSLRNLFFRELHECLEFNKKEHKINYIDTVFLFKKKYMIESVTDDALIKEFYRYREDLLQTAKRKTIKKR